MVIGKKIQKTPYIAASSSSVMLRRLEKRDSGNVCRWMTCSYILQHSFVIPGPKSPPSDFATIEYALRYFDMLMTDGRRTTFAILFEKHHIGNVGLKEICHAEKSAECFIEIGERGFRKKGLGMDAMTLLLDFAFFELGLLEVNLDVLEFNFPALKIYDRLGFIVVGTSGWHYDEFGQYWRVLRMSIRQNNW